MELGNEISLPTVVKIISRKLSLFKIKLRLKHDNSFLKTAKKLFPASRSQFFFATRFDGNKDIFFLPDTKLYVPVVTLSTQDIAKLLQESKSIFQNQCFKRTINRNKYQSKVTIERQSQYLDYLIDPSFQGGNRLFALSFENNTDRTERKIYFFPKVQIKGYNVIDGQNFFD